MPLAEVLAVEVGSAIAKSILKLWLKGSDVVLDASSSILDILKTRTSDMLAQQRARRQFEVIGEKVGESLLPIFALEGAKLNEGGRIAVAFAVAETLNIANISSKLLANYNLESSELAKYLLSIQSAVTQHFSSDETSLYQRIIFESCEYIVDIATQLPAFTEHTLAEVLMRESQLLNITEQILQEVHHIREQLNTEEKGARFELEYRRAVVRNLDVLELFGADVATANRRHRLSVAYVTLSVAQKLSGNGKGEKSVRYISTTGPQEAHNKADRRFVSVDEAIGSSPRLLIRGLAGSGKTTLLQWIAVRSASQSFTGSLKVWNNTLPFYIRLRHCIHSGLPSPETFPKLVTPAISDTMPNGWVHTKLASGHAIVLIDGLDEMPALQRQEVNTWLRDLVGTYPNSRFIITSRPHAVQEGWMNSEGFNDAELQPMGLPDIYAFIDHWHDAVSNELQEEEERSELTYLAKHLKDDLELSRAKRNLATNPLLCAMLCALHRERRQQLPSDRIEMYEACCQSLIERRDIERRVPLTDYPALALTYRQKRLLLEDLAYWLMKNGWSEVERQRIDDRFARKLKNMQGFAQHISGTDARQFLVERTSIIREPIVGQVDFTHRTFQEFLAAKAALDDEDIGLLVQEAHNDQWREVIILASGLATFPIREQLLKGLIARGDKEKDYRYQLHLLAISCLETSIELSPVVKSELGKRLGNLVPPKSMMDAQALASAGSLAVPHLIYNNTYSASTTAACVLALSLIGDDAALEVLEGYVNDMRSGVVDELLRTWDYFDRKEYAQRVLQYALKEGCIVPSNFITLNGFQYLINLKSLNLTNCLKINDLGPLTDLPRLKSLDLTGCTQLKNFKPLINLPQLTTLNLSLCTHISDFSFLASLPRLTKLNLSSCEQIRDLSFLAGLPQLTQLSLSYCREVGNLTPLIGLNNLKELYLTGIYHRLFVPRELKERIHIIY